MTWVKLNGIYINLATACTILFNDAEMRIVWADGEESIYSRKGSDTNMIVKIEEWLKSQVYEFRSRSY